MKRALAALALTCSAFASATEPPSPAGEMNAAIRYLVTLTARRTADRESMKFEDAIGVRSTHWVCFTYRARNRRGGMEFFYTFLDARDYTHYYEDSEVGFREDWERYCLSGRHEKSNTVDLSGLGRQTLDSYLHK